MLKEVFLFQLNSQVRDTLSRAKCCSRQSVECIEFGWFCYGRYFFFIYPANIPQNIPVNSSLSMQVSQEIYSVQNFHPQVFVAQNNCSVLLNLLCTKPSFCSCFVTYESIPGNKTRLLSWNICSSYSHIFFDFLWSMWIFVYIPSLVLILQLMVPRLIWRDA